MQKMLFSLLIALISFNFMLSDVQAKRFGGGKSFGMSRQSSSFNRPVNNGINSSYQQAAAKPASTASKWLGPLAGLAAGGLLASLFMGHGFGTGILSWILIAAALFIGWQFIRNR